MRKLFAIAALAVSAVAHADSFYGPDGTFYRTGTFVLDQSHVFGKVSVEARSRYWSETFDVIVQNDHCRIGGGVALVDFGGALISQPWGSGSDPIERIARGVCAQLGQ